MAYIHVHMQMKILQELQMDPWIDEPYGSYVDHHKCGRGVSV